MSVLIAVAVHGCSRIPAAPAVDLAPDFDAPTANASDCGLERLTLSELVGDAPQRRAVVLNFGATYCKPCLYELPEYQRLAARFHGPDVLMAFVLLDEDPKIVAEMVEFLRDDLGVRFPVLSDPAQKLAARYQVEDLPYLILIDERRQIAWSEAGFRPETMAELERRLLVLVPDG